MGASDASASVDIAASPDTVYGLISDLGRLAELAEETARMRWTRGSSAVPGAVFKGTNRNGWRRWTTKCKVTDAVADSRFAFNVSHTGIPVSRWQYDIAPSDGGCTVTESTWDRRPGWYVKPSALATGSKDRATRARMNTQNMQATLQRLKTRAEAAS
jgi:hypothetical protein